MKNIWTFWNVFSAVLLAMAVGLCMFFSVQLSANGYVRIAGCSLFRVVTGSMEPTISVGEAIICQKTDIDLIQTGDIVCYQTQVSEIKGSVVTHRVSRITTDDTGKRYLETKGDANLATDPYPVTEEKLLGKVIWRSGEESLLTDILAFVTGKLGFLTCIVFPVLLASGLILQSTVKGLYLELKNVRKELERLEQLPESDDRPLPGYSYLTQKDYDDLLETLRAELIKELQSHAAETAQPHTESNR